jgi:hypothetical protein
MASRSPISSANESDARDVSTGTSDYPCNSTLKNAIQPAIPQRRRA